jgi:hypothetical protein
MIRPDEKSAYVQPFSNGGRFYTNVNHTVSLNSGCETPVIGAVLRSARDIHPSGSRAALEHHQRFSG